MKKRKIIYGLLTLSSVFVLTACGGKDEKNATTTKDGLQVKIVDGEYITNEDLKTSSSNKGYLALEVKLKNTGDKSVTYGEDNFTLYTGKDEDEESIEPSQVYDSLDHFKTISYGKVSKGRSKTGYLVYEVDKDQKKYNLVIDTSMDDEKSQELKIPVNATKYNDNTEKITKLAETFVTQTFLDEKAAIAGSDAEAASTTGGGQVELLGSKKSKEWQLTNKVDEDRAAYMNKFKEEIKGSFSDYSPSEADLQKFAQQYIAANSKRAKIEYTVKNYLPTSATIAVKPSVINYGDMDYDSLINDAKEKLKNNNYSDYDQVYKDAEKYIFENMHTRYDSASISTPDSMSGDGYEINLTKDTDTGKWTVDTSDSDQNYYYDDLIQAFTGGINSFY